MWTQRDQLTCTQLPLADEELIRLSVSHTLTYYYDLFVAARHNINIDPPHIDFIFSNYLKWVKSYLIVELRTAHQPLPPLSLCLALTRL